MSTMAYCTHCGCLQQVDEDGYCEVCGYKILGTCCGACGDDCCGSCCTCEDNEDNDNE